MTNQATTTTTANNLSRLTLKSFKTVKFMSEETTCFTAVVCIDGKAIGEAANEGHGGCTFVHYINDAARITAEAFAKTINPADVKGWEFLADKGFEFDCLVDIAVEREGNKKEEAKLLKRIRKNSIEKTTFLLTTSKSGEYQAFKTITNDLNRASRVANAKSKPDFKCFVADMTDAEIIAHFAN